MKAHDAYLTSLLKLSDAIFNIPVYQRKYDWDIENCRQLFLDLETIALTGKDHFIGSIVYISIGTATEPYYNVIDGQQRITSVMLFLKAIHDSATDTRFRKQIQYGFLINAGLGDEPKMKLKQIESDSAVYEKIIMQEEFKEEAFTEDEKNSNVYRNYDFFKTQIANSVVSLQNLYNAVFKLEIIDVCLTTEDPQEVFESMNSTGKTLTNTDLLRNYLLMDLSHAEQEQLFKNYWVQIEKNVGTSLLEQYMVHYLIMKRKSDSVKLHRKSAKVNKNTLYDCYKMYLSPENKKDNGTKNLLEDMRRYSALYRRIVNNDNQLTELDKALYELIYELNADPAAIFVLYLLDIQTEKGVSDDEMLQAIKACISYVFRVRIFKGSVSNQFFALAIQAFERSNVFAPFIERVMEALTSGQGSYRFPKDREFQNAFETKDMYLEFKPPMLRYILYKYERKRTKEVVDPENVTIEHILPQDAKEWRAHLMSIHDDEYPDYTHKIGNLTLTKLNPEASNDPFEKKKKVYAKSGYAITRELLKFDDWNSNEIKRRSLNMAKEAVSIWPLSEKYNKDASSGMWQTMDEDVEALFYQMRDMIKDFDPSIYEESKKLYINFIKDKRILISLIPYQTNLIVTINEKKENLDPSEVLEDISAKGHWGVGFCRMRVTSEEDVWTVLGYIEQITGAKKEN